MIANAKIEFGDFQTPDGLAAQVAEVVAHRGVDPASIIEPTCGIGAFLFAALAQFPRTSSALGVELNSESFQEVSQRFSNGPHSQVLNLRQANFFTFDWPAALGKMPEPILIIGNPPWVTSAVLGSLDSDNLPTKTNFQGLEGLDAKTGKSNFDIAEWMTLHLIRCLGPRRATLAMLLKTSVARRVLLHAWQVGLPLNDAAIYRIDAKRFFKVNADACLFVCDLGRASSSRTCQVYDLERPDKPLKVFGESDGTLVADLGVYTRLKHLSQIRSTGSLNWRSGVKHDCAKVMELRRVNGAWINGFGQAAELETHFLYPMLKGSHVAGGADPKPSRLMIVTQKHTGQDTAYIRHQAPKTWAYLCRHADRLDRRASSIYKNRGRFSVFGVGPYSFAPWKVAICGFYKKLEFSVVGPYQGKPVVFDDTCYFLPFDTPDQARLVESMLRSTTAMDFLLSLIFWDAKRPITADVLKRLDLARLAEELGIEDRFRTLGLGGEKASSQLTLF